MYKKREGFSQTIHTDFLNVERAASSSNTMVFFRNNLMSSVVVVVVVGLAGLLAASVQAMNEQYGTSYGPYDKMEGFFQYANIPDDYSYEVGWNRGNPSHSIGRYEQLQGHSFRTKVKWNDAYEGQGEHYWDYNHGPSAYKSTGGSSEGYYKSPAGPYKPSAAQYDEPAPHYPKPLYNEGQQQHHHGYKPYKQQEEHYDSEPIVPVYKPKVYKSVGYKGLSAKTFDQGVDDSSYGNYQPASSSRFEKKVFRAVPSSSAAVSSKRKSKTY